MLSAVRSRCWRAPSLDASKGLMRGLVVCAQHQRVARGAGKYLNPLPGLPWNNKTPREGI